MENNKNVNSFIKDLENKIIIDEKKLEEFEKQKQNIIGLIDYIKNFIVKNIKLDYYILNLLSFSSSFFSF